MQRLIPLLANTISNHQEWFQTKGSSGVFADLSEENLEEGNFSNAILVEASFQGSNLNKSNFQNSDLRGANFHNAILTNVKFENCNLEEADLMWADLKGSIFDHASISGDLAWGGDKEEASSARVSEMLQLSVSLRDYMYA